MLHNTSNCSTFASGQYAEAAKVAANSLRVRCFHLIEDTPHHCHRYRAFCAWLLSSNLLNQHLPPRQLVAHFAVFWYPTEKVNSTIVNLLNSRARVCIRGAGQGENTIYFFVHDTEAFMGSSCAVKNLVISSDSTI
jgi:hypothetical protein